MTSQVKKTQLENLQTKYKDCKECDGCLKNAQVYGSGNLDANICVIGEGPGADEVKQNALFVGAAGQLLNNILAAVNIKRDDVYFTNVLVCRTSEKNRTPTQSEIKNCSNRLKEELSIVQPKVALLIGTVALQAIFGSEYRIMKYHGQWLTNLNGPCYFYFPIAHPAWVLHSSTEGEKRAKKWMIWQDIQVFYNSLETLYSMDLNNIGDKQ